MRLVIKFAIAFGIGLPIIVLIGFLCCILNDACGSESLSSTITRVTVDEIDEEKNSQVLEHV